MFKKVKMEELKRLFPKHVLDGNKNHHNQKEKRKSKRMVEMRKPKSRV
jgi:hypothetical protein